MALFCLWGTVLIVAKDTRGFFDYLETCLRKGYKLILAKSKLDLKKSRRGIQMSSGRKKRPWWAPGGIAGIIMNAKGEWIQEGGKWVWV